MITVSIIMCLNTAQANGRCFKISSGVVCSKDYAGDAILSGQLYRDNICVAIVPELFKSGRLILKTIPRLAPRTDDGTHNSKSFSQKP